VASWRGAFLVGSSVLLLDQITKIWAVATLEGNRTIDLFWTFRLRLVRNTGAAFSQGEDLGPLLAALVCVVIIFLVRFARRFRDPVMRAAVGGIIGGALGNLLDRVLREGDGFLAAGVVDFLDLQWWPAFNLADTAIVIGGLLMLSRRFWMERSCNFGSPS